jgi:ketosteroid isomerase-like protein
MTTPTRTLIELERKFWQALIDQDADTATGLLHEPALMVSTHGAMEFDHDGYRKMVEQGSLVVSSFELSDINVVFPNDQTAILTYKVRQEVSPRGDGEAMVQDMNDSSTWLRTGQGWRCVMHTETPMEGKGPSH